MIQNEFRILGAPWEYLYKPSIVSSKGSEYVGVRIVKADAQKRAWVSYNLADGERRRLNAIHSFSAVQVFRKTLECHEKGWRGHEFVTLSALGRVNVMDSWRVALADMI